MFTNLCKCAYKACEIFKKYICVNFEEKQQNNTTKLFCFLRQCISHYTYKNFEQKIWNLFRKNWRLSVSENAKFRVHFQKKFLVFEKLYMI